MRSLGATHRAAAGLGGVHRPAAWAAMRQRLPGGGGGRCFASRPLEQQQQQQQGGPGAGGHGAGAEYSLPHMHAAQQLAQQQAADADCDPTAASPPPRDARQHADGAAAASVPAPLPVQAAAPLAAALAPSSWPRTVALCAAAACIMYADRSSMSTAILPMSAEFEWEKSHQGAVLSSFLVGYGATQIMGGRLADRYGGKAVLVGGLLVWSLSTLATPAAAVSGTGALLAVRCLLGLGQGVAFPAIHAILARSVPPERRGRAIGGVMAAAFMGSAIAFGAAPAIIEAAGWPAVFYVFTSASALWLLAAAAVRVPHAGLGGASGDAAAAAAQPQSSSSSSGAAAAASSSPGAGRAVPAAAAADASPQAGWQWDAGSKPSSAGDPAAAGDPSASPGVGIWPLLRRREVWAIAVAQYAAAYGFFGLLAWMPSFFAEHCGVQLGELGAFTVAPYLLQGCGALSAGLLAERLLSAGWPVLRVRVGMQVTSMLGPAACLMLAVSPWTAGQPHLAAGLISAGMALSALASNGVSASHLDIAPRHAGLVFGVGNTAGTLAGLVAVPVTGYLLHATGSWPLVFALAAAHNVLGAVVWAAWAGDRRLPEDGAGPLQVEGRTGAGAAGKQLPQLPAVAGTNRGGKSSGREGVGGLGVGVEGGLLPAMALAGPGLQAAAGAAAIVACKPAGVGVVLGAPPSGSPAIGSSASAAPPMLAAPPAGSS